MIQAINKGLKDTGLLGKKACPLTGLDARLDLGVALQVDNEHNLLLGNFKPIDHIAHIGGVAPKWQPDLELLLPNNRQQALEQGCIRSQLVCDSVEVYTGNVTNLAADVGLPPGAGDSSVTFTTSHDAHISLRLNKVSQVWINSPGSILSHWTPSTSGSQGPFEELYVITSLWYAESVEATVQSDDSTGVKALVSRIMAQLGGTVTVAADQHVSFAPKAPIAAALWRVRKTNTFWGLISSPPEFKVEPLAAAMRPSIDTVGPPEGEEAEGVVWEASEFDPEEPEPTAA